jgi:aminopeptidase N
MIPRPPLSIIAALLLAASCPAQQAPAPAAAAPPAPPPLDATTRDFDQTHVVLRVAPRISEGTVDGEATLSFTSLADPLRTLRLHCLDTQVLSAKDGSGTAAEFSLEGGVLSLRLPQPLARGAAGSVTVAYRSKPTQGLFFHAPTPEAPGTPLEVYSQGESDDNRRWFPCYDLPDDRLTVELFATVPEALKTISNGLLVGSRPAGDGLREDHWKLERAIPSYLVSLIAGRYETHVEKWHDVPLEYNGPPGRLEEMKNGCEQTPSMMEFFSSYTGRPYPYPRYAQTTVWDFVYGGMENASATTMNMRLLHGKEARPNYSSDWLVAHELAHQWFGDLITCRTWEHLWLNEGFATYFTDLYMEHRDGPEEFALRRRDQNRDYMEKTKEPARLGLSPSPRGDQPLELFGGKQYDRGAAILHQLRIEVGDEAFQDGIRRYVRDNADRAATSDDFRASMEAACGRSLDWFFAQWVYGAGYPVLEVSFEGQAGHLNRVVIEQVQPAGSGQPAEFRLTLPVRVVDGKTIHNLRLDVRRRRQVFDLPAAIFPERIVRVGDGGAVLARIKVKQDREAWTRNLLQDSDVTGRIDAVEALGEWPELSAPDLAAAVARDPFWAVRRDAVRALGRVPGKEPLDAIVAAAADPDARVRETAAESLGERTRDEAGALLTRLVGGDASPYVRSQAARSLGKVHAEGAFDLLVGLLKVDSHRETLRAGALDGLRSLGDRRAVELAHPLLAYEWPRGDNFPMREAALRLLLGLAPDEPATRAAVVKLLDDPFHRMRERAAQTAGNYAIREAEPRLKAMAESEPFDSVKAAAKSALEKLAPPKPK